MQRAILFAALAALALGGAAQAQAQAPEKRVALVIGNAAYKEAPLKNPVNDARAMAARLRELGFEVVARENANRAAMASAVGEFVRKLAPGGAALIYYAGHGVQVRGRNYLIPVDVPLETETDLRFQAVDVGTLTDELDQAQSRVSFIVLDACRNNPFERRLRGAARGLAAVDAARGSLIAYATAPGSVAADGEGANGVYTAALLKALAQPGLKAEDVFKRVRIEVSDATKNQQTPWESSSLTGDFVFNLTVTVAPTVNVQPAPPATADREALFWQSVKDTTDPRQIRTYLDKYPNGEFAALAQARISTLERPPAQHVATPPPQQQAMIPRVIDARDGVWEGKEGIWQIRIRVIGNVVEGSIRCFRKETWSSSVPFSGKIDQYGSVKAGFTEKQGSWAMRRVEGKLPKLKIYADPRPPKLDCADGEVTLAKAN